MTKKVSKVCDGMLQPSCLRDDSPLLDSDRVSQAIDRLDSEPAKRSDVPPLMLHAQPLRCPHDCLSIQRILHILNHEVQAIAALTERKLKRAHTLFAHERCESVDHMAPIVRRGVSQ